MTSPVTARFGSRIAAERRRRGWTFAQAADKAGIGATIISNLERGRQGCTLDSAVAIAAAFDLSLDGLTGPCGRCGDHPDPGFACLTCGAEGERPKP